MRIGKTITQPLMKTMPVTYINLSLLVPLVLPAKVNPKVDINQSFKDRLKFQISLKKTSDY